MQNRAHTKEKTHEVCREEKILDNLGLVYMVARRFEGRGLDSEELIQIGTLGLIHAVDRFDESRNLAFSTYAVPLIIGEVQGYLRRDGMLHIGRETRRKMALLGRAGQEFASQNGREATLAELMQLTGLTQEEILMATDAMQSVRSLDAPVGEDGTQLGDLIGEDVEEAEQVALRVTLQDLMQNLDSVQQQLIFLRYFRGKTQTETAQILGLTQVKVSRLEKKTLLQLRNHW